MTYRPNDEQRAVIASTAPLVVVTGGAGTGKTTTAVAAARAHFQRADDQREQRRQQAMRVGVRQPLDAHDRALFISFSRTAVAQILDRAGVVIGGYGPRLEVATFDGFAWRIINHFGAHHGHGTTSTVISKANSKVPGAPPGMTYDELIPAAAKLLDLPAVSAHYDQRYGIIICDEFQDTDTEEWAFLQSIAPHARRLLLGDLNQCIYGGFKIGVDPAARIRDALAQPGAQHIALQPVSYRDPSGVLPAAAEAASRRRFTDPAIAAAVTGGRLNVTRITDQTGHQQIIDLTRHARSNRHTVSIFTHTNAATTSLSDALTDANIGHEQVGFGEAYGEAIAAQLALARFALGDNSRDVLRALAVYITATHPGGRATPPLVWQMQNLFPAAGASPNPALQATMTRLLQDLRAAVTGHFDGAHLGELITGAYGRIGTYRGQQTWTQAAQRTRTALRLTNSEAGFETVEAQLSAARDDALVGHLAPRPRPVQVMNLHQTKGREADTTILLLGPDEYHGEEGEPFPDGSRLLYVVMTRARRIAHLVVPARAHPLWQPLVDACDFAQR